MQSTLTKTPYLILFVILGALGIGTASALITITLAGNVIVTGDLDVEGNLSSSGNYTYSSPQTRTHFIGSAAFTPINSTNVDWGTNWSAGNDRYLIGTGFGLFNAAIQGIPVGATITNLTCHFRDASDTYDITCEIIEVLSNTDECGDLTTSGTPGDRINVTQSCNFSIQSGSYHQVNVFNNMDCGSDCSVYGVTITYTVQEAG